MPAKNEGATSNEGSDHDDGSTVMDPSSFLVVATNEEATHHQQVESLSLMSKGETDENDLNNQDRNQSNPNVTTEDNRELTLSDSMRRLKRMSSKEDYDEEAATNNDPSDNDNLHHHHHHQVQAIVAHATPVFEREEVPITAVVHHDNPNAPTTVSNTPPRRTKELWKRPWLYVAAVLVAVVVGLVTAFVVSETSSTSEKSPPEIVLTQTPTPAITVAPTAANPSPTTITEPTPAPTVSRWNTLGQVVTGNLDSSDRFGIASAISRDGTTFVASADYHNSLTGHVSVYRYNNIAWELLGEPILGRETGGRLGRSVDISDDGNIIVAGAPNKGYVQVFRYQDEQWQQMGQTLEADQAGDWFGWYVSLSGDGLTLAVAAWYFNQNAGQVRVFQFQNNTWVPHGQTLVGFAPNDQLGVRVSLSQSGSRMAVLAWQAQDGSPVTSYGPGYLRVLQFDDETSEWLDLGNTIQGDSINNSLGARMQLSSDGSRLIVTLTSACRVYEYNDGTWKQFGLNVLDKGASDVSISGDGLTVGTGSSVLTIYRHNPQSDRWEQAGADLPGAYVRLSENGQRAVAAGGRTVRVYEEA